MVTTKIFGLFLIGMLLVMSCSKDTPLEPQQQNPPANVKLSRFSEIQKQVFTPTCAVAGCHAGTNPAANLNLEAGKAYVSLVNVASTQNPTMKRVLPGDDGQSYLVKKLTGTGTSQMPLGGPALASATIDSIKKWINLGAQNN